MRFITVCHVPSSLIHEHSCGLLLSQVAVPFKAFPGFFKDSVQADVGQMSFPQFNTNNVRLQTFRDWPRGLGLAPEALVAAGFFYTGLSDWVQCFHCGGGLFAWRRNDDPVTDHARYYPWCPFIRTVCGKTKEQGPWGDNTPPPPIIRPIDLSCQEEDLLLSHPLAKVRRPPGNSVTSNTL